MHNGGDFFDLYVDGGLGCSTTTHTNTQTQTHTPTLIHFTCIPCIYVRVPYACLDGHLWSSTIRISHFCGVVYISIYTCIACSGHQKKKSKEKEDCVSNNVY